MIDWIPRLIKKYELHPDQTVILSVENEFVRQLEESIKAKYKTVSTTDSTKRLSFSMMEPGLKLSSIHSFKGLEAENVFLIIPNIATTDFHNANPHIVIYTAITRAREKLFIFNLGNNEYHDLFESIKL